MSSGHHKGGAHHPNDFAEVERLLDDGKIQAYLRRRFRVDTSHKVPLTGGSSKDGTVYYLDKDLPRKFRDPVLWHERTEKAFRAVLGMSYARAHRLATIAEHMEVDKLKMDWGKYKKEIAGYVRRDEVPQKMPAGFDTGPYKESGTMNLLVGGA